MGTLTLKRILHFKIEIIEKLQMFPLTDLWFLFKYSIKKLKFNGFCVSWILPNSDLETNFLNFQSYKNVSFAQQELFKQIFDVPSLMLTYLFLYLILGTFIKKRVL